MLNINISLMYNMYTFQLKAVLDKNIKNKVGKWCVNILPVVVMHGKHIEKEIIFNEKSCLTNVAKCCSFKMEDYLSFPIYKYLP